MCDYCDPPETATIEHEPIICEGGNDQTDYLLVDINEDNDSLHVVYGYGYSEVEQSINFCPMCGRRLGDI